MFELQVVSNTPMGSVDDMHIVAETFLVQIGYIPKGYDPKTSAVSVRESVPYRLFMEFFMGNINKAWGRRRAGDPAGNDEADDVPPHKQAEVP